MIMYINVLYMGKFIIRNNLESFLMEIGWVLMIVYVVEEIESLLFLSIIKLIFIV